MSKMIRKSIGKICPECEEGKFMEHLGIVVCSVCGYGQQDDAQFELDMREQRRLKDGKVEEPKIHNVRERPKNRYPK